MLVHRYSMFEPYYWGAGMQNKDHDKHPTWYSTHWGTMDPPTLDERITKTYGKSTYLWICSFHQRSHVFFFKMALQIHEDFLPPYTISAKTVIQIASEFTIYVIVIVIIIIIVIIISFIIIIFLIIIFLIYVLKSSHLTQEPSLPPVLRKSHGFLLPALGGVRPGAQSPPRQHRGFADPGRVLRSVAVVVVVVVVVAVVLEVLRSKTTKFNHLRR